MSKGNFSKVTYWPSARRQVANQPGKKIKGLSFRKSSAINTQSTLFFIIPYNLFFPLSLLLGSLRNGHVTLHCADRFLWKSGYFKRFSWWDYTYVQAPGNQPWSWCALIEIHMDRTWGTGYFRDVDILHFGHWKKNGKLSLPLAPEYGAFWYLHTFILDSVNSYTRFAFSLSAQDGRSPFSNGFSNPLISFASQCILISIWSQDYSNVN